MICKVVIVPFLNVRAMALFPFMLFKNIGLSKDPVIRNHEFIHFQQQVELLILPFYVIYLMHYIVNLVRFRVHQTAYRNIVFEREAYKHEQNLGYLTRRRLWAWTEEFKA